MSRARGLVSEAGVAKSVALSPPPVVGGLGVPRADPFDFILQHYYGKSLAPTVADMIEQAIGVFESPEYVHQLASKRRGEPRAAHQRPETGSPTPRKEPDLPERITISWLLEHVPVRFWLWLFGLLAAAFAAGVRWGPLITG